MWLRVYGYASVVCGRLGLGELTKLRAYDFPFWFQVLPVVEGRA